MSKGEKMPHAVIAAAKEDARFKAVEVRRQDEPDRGPVDQEPACRRTRRGAASRPSAVWRPARIGTTRRRRGIPPAVVGLDSTGVAFYRISAPAVDEHETAPLCGCRPSRCCRCRRTRSRLRGGRARRTTATWTSRSRPPARSICTSSPAASGTSGPAAYLFCPARGRPRPGRACSPEPGADRRCVDRASATENTQVCLVQNGLVTQAAVLDTGMADLRGPERTRSSTRSADVMDRFAHDLRSHPGVVRLGRVEPVAHARSLRRRRGHAAHRGSAERRRSAGQGQRAESAERSRRRPASGRRTSTSTARRWGCL